MVDAGFPMKCLVCAVTCTLSESGEIQLDPTLEQEKVRTIAKAQPDTLMKTPPVGRHLLAFIVGIGERRSGEREKGWLQ